MRGIFADHVLDDFMKILGGTFLTSYWKDGRLNFKLHHNNLTNRQAAEWLADNLGGNWSDYLSRNMKNAGFSVFDNSEGAMRKLRYFDQVTDVELLKYIDDLKEWGKMPFGKTFAENFNMLDDFNYKQFKDMGTLGKAGKIMGTVGTLLTVGGDVVENFYDGDTGTWSYSHKQFKDCAVDIGVDLAVGAGSAATGAAVGSLIVPPVGTVVGAGVGMAVDYVANNVKLFDVDGDGKKESLVDSAKIGLQGVLDDAIDWGENMGDDISGWLGRTFAF